MKTIRWMLASYLPMPTPLENALDAGSVRISRDRDGVSAYFIAADCADKQSLRRAIAQRARWELAAVCVFGVMIGAALTGVARFLGV
ncbi:hypothetical protein ACJ51O_37230 (plasmid) [Burkholderia pyrrocinia]|uniref:hypothetical protein n=1 Tax=Burkholderia cepacia complex TaxID=87882 RepID=UPI002147BCAB|nr:hypothetical protein [Burkholderia cepacia]